MARSRRSTSQEFPLFSENTTLGWRYTRRISYRVGQQGVRDWKYRQVFDADGKHIGYQPIAYVGLDQVPTDKTSPAALTARESMINAGLLGKPKTSPLSEEILASRRVPSHCTPQDVDDFVRLTRAKVGLYHESLNQGGDRAVRVYPRRVGLAR